MDIVVKAPTNIALAKYWGRVSEHPRVASTPSLSMTLSNSYTTTVVGESTTEASILEVRDHASGLSEAGYSYGYKCVGMEGCDVIQFRGSRGDVLDGSRQVCDRMARYVQYLRLCYAGILKNPFSLRITTENNFPQGSGLGSSASGFAALTIAVLACWHQAASEEALSEAGVTKEVLAALAREGSGSAGRSIYGGYVSWLAGGGSTEPMIRQEFSADHLTLHDTIFVFSSQSKQVSSTQGHRRAPHSLLYPPRVAGSAARHNHFLEALAACDITRLGELMEQEALEMHAIAMTSHPPICYLSESSVAFITWLREQRRAGAFEGYFTMDAGVNVHVISSADQVSTIVEKAKENFQFEEILLDKVGEGPWLQCHGGGG